MKRLETTILKNLIFNEDYARKILPFIKSEYFTDNTEKILFEEVEEYINHYKHLPNYKIIKKCKSNYRMLQCKSQKNSHMS